MSFSWHTFFMFIDIGYLHVWLETDKILLNIGYLLYKYIYLQYVK